MNTTSKRISTHCVRTPQLLLQYKITAKISIVLWHVSSYNILLETPRFACRKYKIRKFFKDYYITFAYVLFYLPTYLVDECEFLCVKVIIFIIFHLFPIISISQKFFSIFFLTLEKIGIDEKVICYHNISN